MDEIKQLRRKSCDIFSQRVTPIEKYILAGDKTPEHEIKIIYLQKIIEKLRMNLESKYTTNPSSNKTGSSSNKNKINLENQENLTTIKEEIKKIDTYDNNEDSLYEENISNSLDKKSTEFLISLFNMGVCDDEIKTIELTTRQKQTFKLEDNNPYIIHLKKCILLVCFIILNIVNQ